MDSSERGESGKGVSSSGGSGGVGRIREQEKSRAPKKGEDASSSFQPERKMKKKMNSDEEDRIIVDSDAGSEGKRLLVSRMTQRMLRGLLNEIVIPEGISLRIPEKGEDIRRPRRGEVGVYLHMFRRGFRPPFGGFVESVLAKANLAPAQVSPNGWSELIGFGSLWLEAGRSKLPTWEEFASLHELHNSSKTDERWYFMGTDGPLISLPSSVKLWKEKWFWMGGNWRLAGPTSECPFPVRFQSEGNMSFHDAFALRPIRRASAPSSTEEPKAAEKAPAAVGTNLPLNEDPTPDEVGALVTQIAKEALGEEDGSEPKVVAPTAGISMQDPSDATITPKRAKKEVRRETSKRSRSHSEREKTEASSSKKRPRASRSDETGSRKKKKKTGTAEAGLALPTAVPSETRRAGSDGEVISSPREGRGGDEQIAEVSKATEEIEKSTGLDSWDMIEELFSTDEAPRTEAGVGGEGAAADIGVQGSEPEGARMEAGPSARALERENFTRSELESSYENIQDMVRETIARSATLDEDETVQFAVKSLELLTQVHFLGVDAIAKFAERTKRLVESNGEARREASKWKADNRAAMEANETYAAHNSELMATNEVLRVSEIALIEENRRLKEALSDAKAQLDQSAEWEVRASTLEVTSALLSADFKKCISELEAVNEEKSKLQAQFLDACTARTKKSKELRASRRESEAYQIKVSELASTIVLMEMESKKLKAEREDFIVLKKIMEDLPDYEQFEKATVECGLQFSFDVHQEDPRNYSMQRVLDRFEATWTSFYQKNREERAAIIDGKGKSVAADNPEASTSAAVYSEDPAFVADRILPAADPAPPSGSEP